jgi:hypothetical protein
MTPDLDTLEKLARGATSGPWNYEAERYSAKCIIGVKPTDDRWLAHCQPEFNGEANARFICAANPQTILSLIAALRKAESGLEEARQIQRDQAWRTCRRTCEFRHRHIHSAECNEAFKNIDRIAASLEALEKAIKL